MGAKLLQPTLTAGEVSPSLYGRVDIARYPTGLRQCRNFIVRPYGGVENRPGFWYKDGAVEPLKRRLYPFVYAEDLAYVLWFGNLFVRFYTADGAAVAPVAPAYAGGTTYALAAYVTSASIVYRSLQAANVGHTPASSPTWWVADPGLQIATPWPTADLFNLRFTQSADVLFVAHPDHQTRELRRTAVNVFEIRTFPAKDGPFQDINEDEAVKVAASAVQGAVTLTANSPIFAADLVGTLFYLETKNLGQVKPWVVADRSVAVGTVRRSDGKTYICTAVPTVGVWHETGPRTPIHDNGRLWDGAGDTRNNGVSDFSVGVEWEYVDGGYGVVLIETYVSTTSVTGTVKKRLPSFVVGGLGSPANTWNFNGNGVAKTFAIAGAGYGIYSVTIGAVVTQPDPNYTPSGSGGGGCVHVDSILPGGIRAGDVQVGDELQLFDHETWEPATGIVTFSEARMGEIWRIVTVGGASLVCSSTAPIPIFRGGFHTPQQLMGHQIAVNLDGEIRWDVVCDLVRMGHGMVQHITVGDRCFWAGESESGLILHHNAKADYGGA